jgi:hypothetical protein
VIRRPAVTVATSKADDAAFRALHDVASTIAGIDDARIVGGQMVGLLLTAFPTADALIRRTADADTAVSTKVATSGLLHDSLTEAGYDATSGNSYESPDGRAIDVLVPSDTTFHYVELAGRAFDAAPGLPLVLAAAPIILDVDVTLTNGSRLLFGLKVPTVEHALVLKSLTLASRSAAKDLVDIHNLLQIAHQYDADDLGGWRIGTAELSGSRGDAQVALHHLAKNAQRNIALAASGVSQEVLVALIRAHIGHPRT